MGSLRKFTRVATWITRIVGMFITALGIVRICEGLIAEGYSPFLSKMLEAYESRLEFIAGYVEPILIQVMQWFGIAITLEPYWAHISVLLGLYFLSGGGVEKLEASEGRKNIIWFRLPIGLLLALVGGAVVGSFPVSATDFAPNYFIALTALLVTCFNDLAVRGYRAIFTWDWEVKSRLGKPNSDTDTPKKYFRFAAYFVLLRTVVGIVVAIPLIMLLRGLWSPGVVFLMIYTAYLALNQIYLGTKELPGIRREEGEGTVSVMLRSRGMMIGLTMILTFTFAFALIALNVGTKP